MINVAELLADPDFVEEVAVLRRTMPVGSTGRGSLVETADTIVGSVQDGTDPETLAKLPEAARWSDVVTVYTADRLEAEAVGGYGDVVLVDGRRYLVKLIDENFRRFGYVRAVCVAEALSA